MFLLPLAVVRFSTIVIDGVLHMPSSNGMAGAWRLAFGFRAGFLSSVGLRVGTEPLAAISALLLSLHEECPPS